MKQIQVSVNTEGQVTIKPIGFKGESCKRATKRLEEALGSVVSDKPTSEMNEKETNTHVDTRR